MENNIDVETAIYNSLFKRGVIKRNQEFKHENIQRLFNYNRFKFGHFLLDVHEAVNAKEIRFDIENPFNSFETFDEIISEFRN